MQGDIEVHDACAGIGPTYSAPWLSFDIQDLSTFVLPRPTTTGQNISFLTSQAPLTIADLECPSWGAGQIAVQYSVPYSRDYTYGSPYLPIIAPPQKLLSLNPEWIKSCPPGIEVEGPPAWLGLFDPPTALVAQENVVDPAIITAVEQAEQSSEPTQEPRSQLPKETSSPPTSESGGGMSSSQASDEGNKSDGNHLEVHPHDANGRVLPSAEGGTYQWGQSEHNSTEESEPQPQKTSMHPQKHADDHQRPTNLLEDPDKEIKSNLDPSPTSMLGERIPFATSDAGDVHDSPANDRNPTLRHSNTISDDSAPQLQSIFTQLLPDPTSLPTSSATPTNEQGMKVVANPTSNSARNPPDTEGTNGPTATAAGSRLDNVSSGRGSAQAETHHNHTATSGNASTVVIAFEGVGSRIRPTIGGGRAFLWFAMGGALVV